MDTAPNPDLKATLTVVRYEETPAQPPPILSVGVLAWIRANLFGSTVDAILTLIASFIVITVGYDILYRAITEANWFVVTRNLRQFMAGTYAVEELWRLHLVVLLICFAAGFTWFAYTHIRWRQLIIPVVVVLLTGVIPPIVYAASPLAETFLAAGSTDITSGTVTETPLESVGFIAAAGETIRINSANAALSDDSLTALAGFSDRATNALVNNALNRTTLANQIAAIDAELATDLLTTAQREELTAERERLTIPDPVTQTYAINTQPVTVELLDGATLEVLASATLSTTTSVPLEVTLPADGWYIIRKTVAAEGSIAILSVEGAYPLIERNFTRPREGGGSDRILQYVRLTDDFTTEAIRPQIDGRDVSALVITDHQYRGTRPFSDFMRLAGAPILDLLSRALIPMAIAIGLGFGAAAALIAVSRKVNPAQNLLTQTVPRVTIESVLNTPDMPTSAKASVQTMPRLNLQAEVSRPAVSSTPVVPKTSTQTATQTMTQTMMRAATMLSKRAARTASTWLWIVVLIAASMLIYGVSQLDATRLGLILAAFVWVGWMYFVGLHLNRPWGRPLYGLISTLGILQFIIGEGLALSYAVLIVLLWAGWLVVQPYMSRAVNRVGFIVASLISIFGFIATELDRLRPAINVLANQGGIGEAFAQLPIGQIIGILVWLYIGTRAANMGSSARGRWDAPAGTRALVITGILWIAAIAIPLIVLPAAVPAEVGDLLPVVDTRTWGGLLLTSILTVFGILASFPLGVLLALGRRSKLPVVKYASIVYIELVRGVPLITVLFMAQLLVPLANPQLANVDNVFRAMIGIMLFSAAYLAENVRGGLQSVPHGQEEAAKAVGLNGIQVTLLITLPQALRAVIPALVGQCIALFKDTTLVALVGLTDLFGTARTTIAQPEYIGLQGEVYLFIGVIYYIFCYGMAYISRRIEFSGSGAANRRSV